MGNEEIEMEKTSEAYPYLLQLARKLSRRHLLQTIMSDSSTTASCQSLDGDAGHSLAAASAMAQLDSVYGDSDEFYVRYHLTRYSRRGREFLEFELLPNGKLRYANSSSADDDGMIRQEVFLSPGVVDEFKAIIKSSEIAHVDDSRWKVPGENDDRQEIECKLDTMHIAFTTQEIRSAADIASSVDPTGLRTFYYLSLDLKTLFYTLINSHFKTRPFG